MSRGCELVSNPNGSGEVFVATDANLPTGTAVSSNVLEQTTNGGESWETIHPTVEVPGLNTTLAWQGTQLSFAGNRLYSNAVSASHFHADPPGGLEDGLPLPCHASSRVRTADVVGMCAG